MGGNPLLLGFLAFGLLLMVALGVLAILQRRHFADQVRQIQEVLEEAKRLKELEAGGKADRPGTASESDPTDQ